MTTINSYQESVIKDSVRERDGNRCVNCGMTESEHRAEFNGSGLEVHRITPGSKYSVDLGVCETLCLACHDTRPTFLHVRVAAATNAIRTLLGETPDDTPESVRHFVDRTQGLLRQIADRATGHNGERITTTVVAYVLASLALEKIKENHE